MFALTCILLTIVWFVDGYEYRTSFFKQKVDHFGYSNTDYFLQRYLIADQYWNAQGGPVFFYTGNEGDITMFTNNTGLMWEQATRFRALLIFAEHRYYGESLPYGNNSYLTPQNLGYLTSEQALADYASLIYHLKKRHNFGSVIAFGGSYGGMLSAWMRMKYPHIVKGALASSAPILQFPNLSDCGKFAQIVTDDFTQAHVNCSASIRKSWQILRNLGQPSFGRKFLSDMFHLCEDLRVTDINAFIDWVSGTWQNLAMTNYPYATNFLAPLPAHPVDEACKYLTNPEEPATLLTLHIFQAISVFHNYSGNANCFNISVSAGQSLGEEGWSYQSCTEMVMPMCQNGVSDMFEISAWNFTQFSEQCKTTWKVQPDPDKAIIMYGGKNITSASNIFFSNGKLDPWYGGGVLNSLSDSLIAYFIDGAAHHLDLRASNPADPKSVIKARIKEMTYIRKWLSDP